MQSQKNHQNILKKLSNSKNSFASIKIKNLEKKTKNRFRQFKPKDRSIKTKKFNTNCCKINVPRVTLENLLNP